MQTKSRKPLWPGLPSDSEKKKSGSEGLTGDLSVQVFGQVLFDPKVQRNCLTALEGLRQAEPLDVCPDYLLREIKREKERERERERERKREREREREIEMLLFDNR